MEILLKPVTQKQFNSEKTRVELGYGHRDNASPDDKITTRHQSSYQRSPFHVDISNGEVKLHHKGYRGRIQYFAKLSSVCIKLTTTVLNRNRTTPRTFVTPSVNSKTMPTYLHPVFNDKSSKILWCNSFLQD